jgi:hypothetical protein
MGKLHVKNGTPVGSTHLCKSCNWGQFITGYRDSDLLVICTNTNPNMVVPFTVYECSEFCDMNRPDWEQMEKLAINIQPVRVSAKTAGFSTIRPLCPARKTGGDEDEDTDEAARVR